MTVKSIASSASTLEQPFPIQIPQFAAPRPKPDNDAMPEMTREEFDAKQETAAARMDLRFATFQAEVQRSIQANDKAMDQFRGEMGNHRVEMANFRTELEPLKTMKANIWSATAVVVTTVVATVFAAFSLGFGAFDSGRDTSAAIAAGREATAQAVNEAKQLTADTKRLLEEIKANQAAKASQPEKGK